MRSLTTTSSMYPPIDIPEDVSLPEFVLQRAVRFGDASALYDHPTGRQLTFRQVADHAQRLAASLQARGVEPGAVVALLLPNVPEFAVAMLATTLAGGIVTTINPSYSAKEITHQLRDSGALFVVTVASLLPVLRETGVASLTTVVVGDAPATENTIPLSLLVEEGNLARLHKVDIRPTKDVAVLPYSSGTTGLPKGVCLSHYNIIANVLQVTADRAYYSLDKGDTMIGLLPFFHIYGMTVVLLAGLCHGVRIITFPKFDVESFLPALTTHRVNAMHIAPPVATFLAKHPAVPKANLSQHVRDIISGAAPLGHELAEACVANSGCPLRQGYGMTEISPVGCLASVGSTKYASVGRLMPNMEMKIVDLVTGELVAPGERGELLVKGPNVMLGYHNNPQATAATLDADGFLHTGDVAYQDADGDCFIVDRCKELIKVKGYQVAPAELEDVLQGHPAVQDCGVIGIKVESDEAPKAFVVLKAGHEANETMKAQIIEYAARQTAPYKRIRDVTFTTAIPKAASGKILRRELRTA